MATCHAPNPDVLQTFLQILLSSKTGFQQSEKLRNQRSQSNPGGTVTVWIVTVQLDKCGVMSPLDFVSRAFLYGCLAAFKLMFCTIFVCRLTASASIYTCTRIHA